VGLLEEEVASRQVSLHAIWLAINAPLRKGNLAITGRVCPAALK